MTDQLSLITASVATTGTWTAMNCAAVRQRQDLTATWKPAWCFHHSALGSASTQPTDASSCSLFQAASVRPSTATQPRSYQAGLLGSARRWTLAAYPIGKRNADVCRQQHSTAGCPSSMAWKPARPANANAWNCKQSGLVRGIHDFQQFRRTSSSDGIAGDVRAARQLG